MNLLKFAKRLNIIVCIDPKTRLKQVWSYRYFRILRDWIWPASTLLTRGWPKVDPRLTHDQVAGAWWSHRRRPLAAWQRWPLAPATRTWTRNLKFCAAVVQRRTRSRQGSKGKIWLEQLWRWCASFGGFIRCWHLQTCLPSLIFNCAVHWCPSWAITTITWDDRWW